MAIGRIVIRDASPADVPEIVGLLAADQLGAARESVDDFDGYLEAFHDIDADGRNRLIAMFLGDELIGTLQITYIPSLTYGGGERAQLEAIHISRPHRGRGYGRALVQWAIDEARERGCRLVQLTTDRRREGTVAFYEALGFVHTHNGMKLLIG